jgi:hypothetical protein
MPDFAMSEGGRIHFADCKRIFDVVQIICAVCGIFTLVSFFLHRHGGNSRYLRFAGILTIALPAVIGGLAVWNWDWLFVHFHQLFFRNDYWLFDPTADPIILVLPDAFFLQCAGVIMGIILLTIWYPRRASTTPFQWRWSIPLISIFLCGADFAYMQALSQPDALIAVVSMIRRGSVLVSFAIGAFLLREKNLKAKTLDLALMIASMVFLFLGSK